jgi:hypothetical protein
MNLNFIYKLKIFNGKNEEFLKKYILIDKEDIVIEEK